MKHTKSVKYSSIYNCNKMVTKKIVLRQVVEDINFVFFLNVLLKSTVHILYNQWNSGIITRYKRR